MNSETPGQVPWPIVTFPNSTLREKFLEMLHLLNKHEGVPRIDVERLTNGVAVRLWFWSADARFPMARRLVDSYGGRLEDEPGPLGSAA
jgi:hypothetical protein